MRTSQELCAPFRRVTWLSGPPPPGGRWVPVVPAARGPLQVEPQEETALTPAASAHVRVLSPACAGRQHGPISPRRIPPLKGRTGTPAVEWNPLSESAPRPARGMLVYTASLVRAYPRALPPRALPARSPTRPCSKRRVGFVSSGAPARQHSVVSTPDGKVVGEVTSGAFSPCLKTTLARG